MTFENARIVKKQATIEEYQGQTVKRGEDGYVIGRSDLCEIAQCPHKWLAETEDDDTKSTEWGTLIDAMILGGELNIAVTPETYGDEGKPWNWNAKECRAWREANKGRIIVKPAEMAEAEIATKRIRGDPVIEAVLKDADYQVWLQADWRVNDKLIIPVKGLVDIAPKQGPTLADLKTTQSAALRAYSRSIYNFGYHVQAALYLDLWNAATGEKRKSFLHVVQESDAPYEVGRRLLDNEWITLGRASYQNALRIYGQCLETGIWPSYDDMGGSSVEQIDGWTVTSPEPWMIISSDFPIDNRAGILGNFKV